MFKTSKKNIATNFSFRQLYRNEAKVARRILLGDNTSGGEVMPQPIMLEFRVSAAVLMYTYALQINPCTGLNRPEQALRVLRF
jgi:hypothetical protein